MFFETGCEDELASVIAHEIGHDAFLHAPKTVTRQMFWMTHRRKVTSLEDTVNALRDLNTAYEKHTLAAIGENLLGWSRFNELEAEVRAPSRRLPHRDADDDR